MWSGLMFHRQRLWCCTIYSLLYTNQFQLFIVITLGNVMLLGNSQCNEEPDRRRKSTSKKYQHEHYNWTALCHYKQKYQTCSVTLLSNLVCCQALKIRVFRKNKKKYTLHSNFSFFYKHKVMFCQNTNRIIIYCTVFRKKILMLT